MYNILKVFAKCKYIKKYQVLAIHNLKLDIFLYSYLSIYNALYECTCDKANTIVLEFIISRVCVHPFIILLKANHWMWYIWFL